MLILPDTLAALAAILPGPNPTNTADTVKGRVAIEQELPASRAGKRKKSGGVAAKLDARGVGTHTNPRT